MNPHLHSLPSNFSLSLLDVLSDMIHEFSEFGPDNHFHMLKPGSSDILMQSLIMLTMERFNKNDEEEYYQLEKKFIQYLNTFGVNDEEAHQFILEYVSRLASKILYHFSSIMIKAKPEEVIGIYKLKDYFNGSAFFEQRRIFNLNSALGKELSS